jgi:hypothetical protein
MTVNTYEMFIPRGFDSYVLSVPVILYLECDFIYALESELYELYIKEVPQKHMQRGKIWPDIEPPQKEPVDFFNFTKTCEAL